MEGTEGCQFEVLFKPEYIARTEQKGQELESGHTEPPSTKKDPSEQPGECGAELDETNGEKAGYESGKPKLDRRFFIPPHRQYCTRLLEGKECGNPKCQAYHNPERYKATKEPPTLKCYNMLRYGECKFGVNCMFDHEGLEKPTTPEPVCECKNMFTVADTAGHRKELQSYKSRYQKEGRYHEVKTQRDLKPKPLDLNGKLMLASMCTVGNVAFRRLCISFGADVTCTELCMAKSFVKGLQSEFARVKRHSDEKLFGINIAGSGFDIDCAAPFLSQLDCDFYELNACCPDQSIIRDHAGSFLLTSQSRFDSAANAVMRICYNYENVRPYTIKSLLGMNKGNGEVLQQRLKGTFDRLVADKMPLPSYVTGHGRYAISRTSSTCNWDSIRLCAHYCQGMGVGFVPNGDVFQVSDVDSLQSKLFNGVTIGRGALVKPWIFKEIKDRVQLDPNSSERMDYMRRFAGFLVDANGSDYIGRERARIQFLENFSWMSKYVPTGILLRPQRLNDRIGKYEGRDEMETLLGSQATTDWVQVSEHLFGKVPQGFRYAPKYDKGGK